MSATTGTSCEPNASPLATDEFARDADRWLADEQSRRSFLKRMAAGVALAGAAGCSSRPEGETIVPYVDLPDGLIPGVPTSFSSTIPLNGFGRGVLVTSREGKPIKIEGNPDHPSSLGGTDAQTQASILDLWDPTRARQPMFGGVATNWSTFFAEFDKQVARGGERLRVLSGAVTSPTLGAQIDAFDDRFASGRWHAFEPLDAGNAAAGARLAFGRDVDVVYDFSKANVVVSLDADFLIDGPGAPRYARDFMAGRRVRGGRLTMNRLYVAESAMTLTGARADHRLPVRPGEIEAIARALADRNAASNAPAWLTAVAADLAANRGASIVLAGPSQPPAVHALCHAINVALGNVGTTVRFVEPIARRFGAEATLAALTADLRAGRVETLLIFADDPAHASPDFADALAAASRAGTFTAHLAPRYNETSFACRWHLPRTHWLEEWGDVRGHDGTASIVQPLIAPLADGRPAIELVDRLLGRVDRQSYAIVREHWSTRLGDDFEGAWRDALKRGTVAKSAAASVDVGLPRAIATSQSQSPAAFDLVVRPDPSVGDGAFYDNAWLQELPRPFTKIVWNHAALLSLVDAKQLGVSEGDVVRIEANGRSIELPAAVLPGTPAGAVTVHAGYGKRWFANETTLDAAIGANVYALLPADHATSFAATVTKSGARSALVQTRSHNAMAAGGIDPTRPMTDAVVTPADADDAMNRRLVRIATLDAYAKDPAHVARALGGEKEKKPLLTLYPDWDYSQGYQWGMSIDTTACIGCNACIVACQSENNIPVVGADQVGRQREMHWLRVDDYFSGDDAESPRVTHQPVPCMHCENAPCEVVCPVGATVHSVEGLNQMVYNRCVGTRYCSNNCPYKVRRFNFLDYTEKLRKGSEQRLGMNPDVTVRARGVMEKCSYCLQRLQRTRILAERVLTDAKEAARRASDPTEKQRILDDAGRREFAILDGLDTACGQACPTRAITFGSIRPVAGQKTRLMNEKTQPLDYVLLRELTTRPRTSYLARLTNPKPAISSEGAAS